MPHIIVREPGRMTFSLRLLDRLRIGRHETSNLVLYGTQVSRHHAEIVAEDHGWTVNDLGSTHGTLVNGERITARVLRDGDRLHIGTTRLNFHLADEPERIVLLQSAEATPPVPEGDAADRRLKLFYELGRAISALGDTDELLDRFLKAILDVLGCERTLVALWEPDRGSFRQIARQRGGALMDEIVLTQAVVDATMSRRERVIFQRDHGALKPFGRTHIKEAMAAPLALGERSFGLLYVDDREYSERFTSEDLDFLASLGLLMVTALDSAERYQRATAAAETLSSSIRLDEIVGNSPSMRRLKDDIRTYGADRSASVLILGESGTGKELIARALHAASPRAGAPLVALNCAAIPESLIESELCGHVRGSFTGAVRDRRGKFELANGSTLFLDEIGDLHLTAQAKVLRVIQEGEVQPIGSERVVRVNVRIFAATHKDLEKEIAAKRFREDLYYRLKVLTINAPPLRERGEDVVLLAQTLLQLEASRRGKSIQGFTPAALAALRRHRWPGNVRELKNEMERAAIISRFTLVDLADLSPEIAGLSRGPMPPRGTLAERYTALDETEKQILSEALQTAGGNLAEAARLLGITRIVLKRRIEKFGLRARRLSGEAREVRDTH